MHQQTLDLVYMSCLVLSLKLNSSDVQYRLLGIIQFQTNYLSPSIINFQLGNNYLQLNGDQLVSNQLLNFLKKINHSPSNIYGVNWFQINLESII